MPSEAVAIASRITTSELGHFFDFIARRVEQAQQQTKQESGMTI
jgi:hypothetical protein